VNGDLFYTDGSDLTECHGAACNVCKPIGGGPLGVTTGSSAPSSDIVTGGSVLVADFSGQDIAQYDSSCTLTAVYYDTGYQPEDAAFGPSGEIAWTNNSTTSFGNGNITFYQNGKKSRVATGLFAHFWFGAFDKRGDFFNDGETASGTVEIGVVPPGSTIDQASKISGVLGPGGIVVARNGTVNIVDSLCPCIRIYKSTKQVGDVMLTGAVAPVSLALNKKNTIVWVTDESNGTVAAYPYPKGGKPVTMFNVPNAFGVGILPAPPN
jgi:hypothetical protein